VLFSNDYKHFYCRYSDPTYVKKLKLEMLTAVANESNTYEIGKLQVLLSFFCLAPLCWT
jgi:vesicle coat complex subunit